VELGGFLPVAGVAVARTTPGLQASLRAAYTTDRLELIEGDPTPLSGLSAQLRVAAVPVDGLRVGGFATGAQQAAVALGPAWRDVSVEAQALGLWQAGAWLDWEVVPGITVSLDEHHQEVAVFTARTTDRAGAVVDLGEPRFTDSQLSARAVVLDHLRIEPRFRWRMRPDRHELRWGARLEGFDLGIDGPFARASAFFDELTGGQPDRVAWAASAGWDRGDLDAEAGARVTERELAPFSGRRASGERGEDLSPFVIGTQQVAFAHVGWTGETLFVAADVERSLRDDEWRAFVQVGAMAGVGW
jgi:hypothetical protein